MYRFQLTPSDLGHGLGQAPPAVGVLWKEGTMVAQGALWWEGAETMVGLADLWAWDKGPSGQLPIVGRLGHLEAADGEAAVEFLRQTCAVLSQRGCNHVLGPMDGSTWQSYRCATDWHQGQPLGNPKPIRAGWSGWPKLGSPRWLGTSRVCAGI